MHYTSEFMIDPIIVGCASCFSAYHSKMFDSCPVCGSTRILSGKELHELRPDTYLPSGRPRRRFKRCRRCNSAEHPIKITLDKKTGLCQHCSRDDERKAENERENAARELRWKMNCVRNDQTYKLLNLLKLKIS